MNAYEIDQHMKELTVQLTKATQEFTAAYEEYTTASDRWAEAQAGFNAAHEAIINKVIELKDEASVNTEE